MSREKCLSGSPCSSRGLSWSLGRCFRLNGPWQREFFAKHCSFPDHRRAPHERGCSRQKKVRADQEIMAVPASTFANLPNNSSPPSFHGENHTVASIMSQNNMLSDPHFPHRACERHLIRIARKGSPPKVSNFSRN